MAIFKIEEDKAVQLSLKRDGFGNEFGLRDFFAGNLEAILGVRFLEKEYPTPDGRIDTLGLDENNAPVIIEYKWKENKEVFSQGLFYLEWLLKNKKHFELLAKSKLGQDIEIDWHQPRVILVAQDFSKYTKSAVEMVENVELMTYDLHDGNVLRVESQYNPHPHVDREVKRKSIVPEHSEYDFNYHMSATSPELQKLFNDLRVQIVALPDVEERLGQKSGITYKTTKSFTRFEFGKTHIRVLLRDASYPEDSKGIVKDITSNAWGYLGMIKLTADMDASYVFNLIKASYNSTL